MPLYLINFIVAEKISQSARSRIMSRIKGKWTAPEIKIHNALKGNKIKHKMHPYLKGNPDVFLKDYNTVIFIDGCFWHNCPKHGHIPQKNIDYWKPKLEKNIKRDIENTEFLQKLGYKVLRIWECDVMSDKFSIKDINFKLSISRFND